MRNHRSEYHRQARGHVRHVRQVRMNTVTITTPQAQEILMRDCEAALENDALYRINIKSPALALASPLPEFNRNNIWRTLVMRVLQRAGYNRDLSRQMCLAYGFQPAA